VEGLVMQTPTVAIIVNLAIDLLYAALDPRLRYR
jgi:ABC-type dipeptide/oligopeptide/nickel transport system permease component